MTISADKPAPYAPASAVLELVTRYRDRGLPTPVTAEVLTRAGISDSLNSRTLYSLQSLDLIDEAGQPTPTFEAIRKAPAAELNSRMIEWLNGAYADALKFIDPATADETAIHDAFRNYNPPGQRARMVTLFIGLYAAAGIGTEKPVSSRPPRSRIAQPRIVRSVNALPRASAASARKPLAPANSGGALPEPIAGMLSRLPAADRGWTQPDRDRFLTTFGTVLDFCFPIVTKAELEAAEDEKEDA